MSYFGAGLGVGQDGILRGDWQSPRGPGLEGNPNRSAGCLAANLPHIEEFTPTGRVGHFLRSDQ